MSTSLEADVIASSSLTRLVGHREEHRACKKSIDGVLAGMVVCLEPGANDLHMVQLMLLAPSHPWIH